MLTFVRPLIWFLERIPSFLLKNVFQVNEDVDHIIFFDLGNDYNHDGGAGISYNQMFLSDINQPVCCEDDGIKNSHKMAGRK